MANIKANEKSNRQATAQHMKNKAIKSEIKTSIKKAKTTKSDEDKNHAISLIDKAVSKNVYKKNKAANLKSKVHKIS